jgi:serine protease
MKKIVAIAMALLLVMSVTVLVAGNAATTKEVQPEKVNLQIFENKEINVPGEEEFVADEILVKFKQGVGKEKIDKINSKHRGVVKQTSPYSGTKRIAIPKGKTVPDMVKLYQAENAVEYAKPNYICRASSVPNDPYYSYQWHFPLINMPSAWGIQGGGDPNIVVAVLDTGIAYENYEASIPGPGRGTKSITYVLAPDLEGTSFVQGYDFVNDDNRPNDDEGHGTHVTGTIAQTTNNDYGVAGMAFGTAIMPVKVLDKNGGGTVQSLADGLYYAADHGADVISMSLGFGPSVTPENIQPVTDAVEYASNKGCILVASSGNDGVDVVSLPAAYPEVIAVGAVHSGDLRASYSQYGSALEVVAPGGDTADRDGNGYIDGVLQQTFSEGNPTDFGFWFYTGTSMAAPHVSGLVALLLAQDETRTQEEIREILQATSVDLGYSGWDEEYGHGRIDAYAALSYTAGTNEPPVANAGGLYEGMEDEAIRFDGSASYDPDVDPLTYTWDFGDGTQATVNTHSTTHIYTTGKAGVTVEYPVTLIVNDGTGDSEPSITSATVDGVNDLPVADAGGPYSGIVNEPITFDGSGSRDEEEVIVAYTWDFGDDSTATGVLPTHTYTSAGTYRATLTVTDEDDATSAVATTAEVTAAPTDVMHVADIYMWYTKIGRNYKIYTTVTIVDSDDAAVEDATVSLDMTSPAGSTSGVIGSTANDGTVTFVYGPTCIDGTYTSTVTDVAKEGFGYDSDANTETRDFISVP